MSLAGKIGLCSECQKLTTGQANLLCHNRVKFALFEAKRRKSDLPDEVRYSIFPMTEETTMKKKLLVAAVVGAVAAPGASLAAIDDAGMQYISASEGLQGSIRIRLIDDTDGENRGVQTAYSSSRLIYRGDADLGGGLAATYLFEFRPQTTVGNGGDLHTENVDAGLRGPFGWIRAGRIESVSSAILPSADLTADVGSTGQKLADSYDNGIRWTSPDINGLMLGLSAMMVDQVKETTTYPAGAAPVTATENIDDDTIDQFDLAAVYSLPQGIRLGASYTKLAAGPEPGDDYGDTDGFRLGVSYGQDNWSVAYNFHSYDGNNPREFTDSLSLTAAQYVALGHADAGEIDESNADTNELNPANAALFDVDGHKDTEYTEHAMGARVELGRIALAVNYLLSNLENGSYDTRPITDGNLDTDSVQSLDYDVSEFAFDASYSLGSQAWLTAAFKSVDKDDHPVTGEEGADEDSYYLLYRVDF